MPAPQPPAFAPQRQVPLSQYSPGLQQPAPQHTPWQCWQVAAQLRARSVLAWLPSVAARSIEAPARSDEPPFGKPELLHAATKSESAKNKVRISVEYAVST